jgi:hypothetical protein
VAVVRDLLPVRVSTRSAWHTGDPLWAIEGSLLLFEDRSVCLSCSVEKRGLTKTSDTMQ